MSADAADKLRVDKWLWFARFYKTRGLAAKAVSGGHIRINGTRVKPSHDVCAGDSLAIQRGSERIECTVSAIPARRGPAREAQQCYVETEASIEKRTQRAAEHRAYSAALAMPTRGRPDKRTRRMLRSRFRETSDS